jgi:hypothetical protein
VNENHSKPKQAIFQRFPYARSTFYGGLAILLVVILGTGRLSFEYEFGKLEPEFTEYNEFRAFVGGSSSTRRNPAYIIAETDDQVLEILEQIREIQREKGDSSTILDVEALQERFPVTTEQENAKLDRIAEIRELLTDPFITDQQDQDLDRIRRASGVTEPLVLDDLPAFMKERFITRDGQVGRFVMIYPAVGLSDGRNSIAFKNEIASIKTHEGSIFYAASTSISAAEMLSTGE